MILMAAVALLASTLNAQTRPAATPPAAPPAPPATAPSADAAKSNMPPFTRDPLAALAGLKPAPFSIKTPADLKQMQDRVEIIAKYATPAIVNIQIMTRADDGSMQGEQGSGVIVSPDGYVLTAGHVSGEPNKDVTIILSNGQKVAARTLGANTMVDSGMLKIKNPGEYPYMPLGSTMKMEAGQWVIAMGHPGGLQDGRPPVVRLGTIIGNIDTRRARSNGDWYIQTDCPLIMGDSGGPVFDLDGRVIAINSKIGLRTSSNIHVPVDTFVDTWDRLAKGDKWSSNTLIIVSKPTAPRATLGATLALDGTTIQWVRDGMAADRANIRAGDIITKLDDKIVKTVDDLSSLLAKHKPGDSITLEFDRDGKNHAGQSHAGRRFQQLRNHTMTRRRAQIAAALLAAACFCTGTFVHAQAVRVIVPERTAAMNSFQSITKTASKSTLIVRAQTNGYMPAMSVLGTVVTADGYILTKGSEVVGHPVVWVQVYEDGQVKDLDAKIVGYSEPYDLAMLKVDVKGLTPVSLADTRPPEEVPATRPRNRGVPGRIPDASRPVPVPTVATSAPLPDGAIAVALGEWVATVAPNGSTPTDSGPRAVEASSAPRGVRSSRKSATWRHQLGGDGNATIPVPAS